MTTTFDTGRQAETAVAAFLQKQGFKIIEQNWRTRWCEIDVVAAKAGTVYFVEVKYRHSDRQGSGIEYITERKMRQMRFAAESWVGERRWRGGYQLAAAEVSGDAFDVTNFIESIV
jgi:ribonuclease HII